MKIIGVGSYLPEDVLTNTVIENLVKGTSDEWTKEKLGIKERRIAKNDVSDLALKASENALKDANLTIHNIDFILLVTSSPERISPSTACILHDKIKAYKIPCLDINAVCSGFIYGMQIAKGLLSLPQYNNILLVATEKYSKITDWKSRNAVFFGDGSGAVILQKDNDNFCEIDVYGEGSGKNKFTVHHNEKFEMDGKEVYKNAISKLPDSIFDLLIRTNKTTKEISHVIPHQPSINILKETAEIINVDFNKFGITMDRYANTAGASIPITMDDMYKQNKFKKGDLLLLTAIGSGWVWGSGLIEWTKE